jgi:hypothetical protein
MKVTTHFLGDWDAGIYPCSYEAEIPELEDNEDREEIRKYKKGDLKNTGITYVYI